MKITPVKINHDAFGANIVTVVFEGKVHTFVGAIVPRPPRLDPNYPGWSGKEASTGYLLSLSKSLASGDVGGGMFFGARRFEIRSDAIVEVDYGRGPGVVPARVQK